MFRKVEYGSFSALAGRVAPAIGGRLATELCVCDVLAGCATTIVICIDSPCADSNGSFFVFSFWDDFRHVFLVNIELFLMVCFL